MDSGTKYLLVTIVSPEPQQGCPHHGPKITIVGSGFPHSDTSGSMPVRGSPELFAAYHVLHRLSVPRHPPNALKTLDRSHYRYPPRNRSRMEPDLPTWLRPAPGLPSIGSALNMIRKTILLHHPSGSHTPQDKAVCDMGPPHRPRPEGQCQ